MTQRFDPYDPYDPYWAEGYGVPRDKSLIVPPVVDDDYDDMYWQVYELSGALESIKRNEAADYIEQVADGDSTMIMRPTSMQDSRNLIEVFDWHETPQGYGFWEEIYHELVSTKWEEYRNGE